MREFFKGFWRYLVDAFYCMTIPVIIIFLGIVTIPFMLHDAIRGCNNEFFMTHPKVIAYLRELADTMDHWRRKKLEKESSEMHKENDQNP